MANNSDQDDLLKKLLDEPKKTAVPHRSDAPTFSFIFFSSDALPKDPDVTPYDLVFELAKFGDENGFEALWLPERHFHHFGGAYPNPAVLAASIAVQTKRIRLRSGSVVLPLHHPLEVVEAWAMVDNLSGGRVDLGFASGWNPNDFIWSPETYPNLRDVWKERIKIVQKLWRGETLTFKNGVGKDVSVRVFPPPIQKELDVWFVITKLDESFRYAGLQGYKVLTMMQGVGFSELKRKIQIYQDARVEAGYDRKGCVTLMFHTCIHKDTQRIEQAVNIPFHAYIKSAFTGHIQMLKESERPNQDEINKILEYSYERYYKTAALFGTVEDARNVIAQALDAGVTEIAVLMDFGIPHSFLQESLPYLKELKRSYE